MFRRRQIPKKSGEGENPFLLTFSDFMASLLAIFILVLIVTLIELDKNKKDQDAAHKKRQAAITVAKDKLLKSLEDIQDIQGSIANSLGDVTQREGALSVMLKDIKKDLKERGIDIAIVENDTVLRIPEQQLQFALGQDEIPLAHTGPASAIGQALLQALSKDENRTLLDTVFVEGHTDSVPNSRKMGNWGLSTYRAISLWNFWTDKPGELAGLKTLITKPTNPNIEPKLLISVSGYADTRSTNRRLDGVPLKNDRPEDRRIDIRFTLVSSEKQNLEGLQSKLEAMGKKTNSLIKELKELKEDEHAP